MPRRGAIGDVTSGTLRLVRGLVPFRRATPRRLVRMARSVSAHGLTLAGLTRVAAIRDGRDIVLVDRLGPVSADQLDRWTATVAGELVRRELVVPGSRLGVLCRSGRSFLIATIAASRVGADAVLLDPDAPGTVLAEVLRANEVHVVAHDEELGDLLAAARFRGTALVADAATPPGASLRAMAALPQADVAAPRRPGRLIVLTGGSGGRPKAARRSPPGPATSLPVTTLLRRLAIRRGSAVLIAVPLHRALGLGFMSVSLGLGCRAVLPRAGARADDLLDLGAEHGVETLVVFAEQLPTLVAALEGRAVPPSLRAVVTSGGRLDPDLWRAATAAFGPIVWNLYGGAIAGWCSLASPDELAIAPGTIGTPAAGVELAVLDGDGEPAAPNVAGRLLVSSPMAFDPATPAGVDARVRRGEFVDTGDIAHRDEAGRWFIDPRPG